MTRMPRAAGLVSNLLLLNYNKMSFVPFRPRARSDRYGVQDDFQFHLDGRICQDGRFLRSGERAGQGDFHDQADTKWIVIRETLSGHSDTPCGRPTPKRPTGRP
jgi:hypothetical protein